MEAKNEADCPACGYYTDSQGCQNLDCEGGRVMQPTSVKYRFKKGEKNYLIADLIARGMKLDENNNVIMPSGRQAKGTLEKTSGYHRIYVWDAKTKSSRMVIKARIVCWLTQGPPPEPHYEVDHINQDRSDDSPSNLRWVKPGDNSRNMKDVHKQRSRTWMNNYHADYKRMKDTHDALVEALRIIASQSIGDDWTPEQAIKFVRQHAREALTLARKES